MLMVDQISQIVYVQGARSPQDRPWRSLLVDLAAGRVRMGVIIMSGTQNLGWTGHSRPGLQWSPNRLCYDCVCL